MREITMKNGTTFLIDDEDYEIVSKRTWYLSPDGYVKRCELVEGKKKTVSVHRLVMNAPAGMQVDHINRNPLDNRKENLRICTASQNACNRPKLRTNKSGYKGVAWDYKSNKWRVQIDFEGNKTNVGCFTDPREAHRAYCEKAKELQGEYARFE